MSLFNVYPLYDVTPVKAKDVYIYDDKKIRYIDLYGGHAVISIGHSHPRYIAAITNQVNKLGFYSNAIQNPLQEELAEKLNKMSGCTDYQLFLCNSGAEANENALKLASMVTGRPKVLACKNSFHGRTSAAVAATDNQKIVAPINAQHQVDFIELGDLEAAKGILNKKETCAVIVECIQGVGGLDEATSEFYKGLEELCQETGTLYIADEVQSGFGRTGDFFAFQKHSLTPDVISIAKGMGNGFPVGGIMIHPKYEAKFGMLGTTFGGNHLACAASLMVLSVMDDEDLVDNVKSVSKHFMERAQKIKHIKKVKGRGLMLGLEFDFNVSDLRKKLIYDYKIFTGSSNNPNLIRILPPMTVQNKHIDMFFDAIEKELKR